MIFLNRCDCEIAVLDGNVFRAPGVVLELVIAPAVISNTLVVVPLRGIRRRTIRLVEFIAPDKNPTFVRFRRFPDFRCDRPM
jgi:hypothetical protein